jgi:TP901 family phage tail tape measure protein
MADLVSAGIKALIQGLKDVAKYAKEAYQEFDKGYDNLIKATGATGESAKALEDSYKNVSKSVKADMIDIGSAIGEVNTRFGYTGSELEKASEAFLKFSDVTGTDATEAVRLVSRAMENAGIDAGEYQDVLDKLATAGQGSGISVSKLAESLTKNGATMRALGFDTDESIAILSKFEKEGVNTETALTGMKTAFKNWSEEGKDAKREYERMVRTIQLTSDSTEAAQIAVEVFGKKAGPEMAELIRQGKLSYSDYLDVIEGSVGTVENTYEQTQDAFDKIQLAAQGLKADVGSAFKNLLNEYSPEINAAVENIRAAIGEAFDYFINEIFPVLKDCISWIIDNLPIIEALVAAIGAAFVAWKVVGIVTAVTAALEGMTAAEVVLAAKQALLNAVMAANPIGLIVTAIAGLVAAFVVLWNKSDSFRAFWIDLWDSIQETVGDAIDWIRDVWAAVSEFFVDIWDSIKETAVGMWEKLKDVFSAAWEIIKAISAPIVDYFKMIWENIKAVFSVVKSVLSGNFKGAWDGIKKIWDNTTNYFKNVWKNVKNVFSVVKDYFKDVFSSAWEAVKQVFANVGEFFGGIWDTITSKFKTIGSAIGDAIGGAFKTAINAVIGTVEKGLNVIPGVINGALDLINELPGVDISPMSEITLPRLARGGVLKRGQVGILEGNGAEAVVPLEKNTRWLDEIASRIYDKMSAPGIGNTPSPAQGVVNNFYQTNNSPKALSRLEIYRQSKNLLRLQGG